MKLNTQGLREVKLWEKAGYALPQFDREKDVYKRQTGVCLHTQDHGYWTGKPV